MIEAYRIGASLILDTNMGTALPKLVESFEALDRLLKQTQRDAAELGSALRGIGRAEPGLRTLAATMERLHGAAHRAAQATRDLVNASQGEGSRSAAATLERVIQSGPSSSRQSAGGNRGGGGGPVVPFAGSAPPLPPGANPYAGARGNLVPYGYDFPHEPGKIPLNYRAPKPRKPVTDTDYLLGGATAGVAGLGAADVLRHVFTAGFDANTVIERMRAARFSPKEIERSKSLARVLVDKVPGLSYVDALDLINQTAAFTGDVGESLALTPTLAFNAQVLKQYGKGDAIAQIEKAVQAGELTGLTAPNGKMNIPKLTDFVNRLTQTVVAGGGTLDLGNYLTGIRQFGIGADAASLDFLTTVLPAYMKIMGGAKSGTALASFSQSLMSVRPRTQNKRYFEEQERLGIRDKRGDLIHGDVLRTNANAYIVDVLLPLLYSHGYRTPSAIEAELYRLLPRQTMNRLVGAGIFDAGVITKEADRNRAQQSAGAAPLQALLAKSPANQVASFLAALNLFETTLSDPNMGAATKSLQDLTKALRGLANFTDAHPTFARGLIDLFAGIAAIGIPTSVVLLGIPGLKALVKIIGAISGAGVEFATGSAAAAGLGFLSTFLAGLAAIGMLWYGIHPSTANKGEREELDKIMPLGPDGHRHWAPGYKPQSYHPQGGSAGSNIHPAAVYLDGRKVGEIIFDHAGRSRPQQGTTGFDRRVTPIFPGQMATA